MSEDIKEAGALAAVVRYGVPWHGRIEGGVLHTGKLDALGAEITRSWTQPATPDCWLIKKPGLPDPYLDDADGKTAAALEGKELTNYALLSGFGDVHGKRYRRVGGYKCRWIWFDDAGEAWAVEFAIVSGTVLSTPYSDVFGNSIKGWAFADDMTVRLRLTRFGELRHGAESAVPLAVDTVIAGGALGQATPAITGYGSGFMELHQVNPAGSKVIMQIQALVYPTVYGGYDYSPPIGYVQFALSGLGSAPDVAVSVLATRAQTIGTHSISGGEQDTFATDCAPCEGTTGYCSGTFTHTSEINITESVTNSIRGMAFAADGSIVAALCSWTRATNGLSTSIETFDGAAASSGTTDATASETVNFSGTLSFGSNSITVAAVQTILSSYTRVSSGGVSTCDHSVTYNYSGSGLTTYETTATDTICQQVIDPSNCGSPYDVYRPVPQPTAEQAALIALGQAGIRTAILVDFYRHTHSLHGIYIGRPSWSGGQSKALGCIGLEVANLSVNDHPAYAAFNPYTLELRYPLAGYNTANFT